MNESENIARSATLLKMIRMSSRDIGGGELELDAASDESDDVDWVRTDEPEEGGVAGAGGKGAGCPDTSQSLMRRSNRVRTHLQP